MKKITFLITTVILLMCLCSCSKKDMATKQTFAFDTVVNISLEEKDIHLTDTVFKMCRDYEKLLSRTDPSSKLSELNSGKTDSVPEEIRDILEFSLKLSEITGGAFDVTVAPLMDLWNISERNIPPTDKEIEQVLPLVGYEKIDPESLTPKNASLDFGAIAKGYIADAVIEKLKEENVENAIVDLGGNVALIGEYKVGIRDPFNPGKVFATITLKDKSAVTSGAYQRYFEYDGVRYHHIIDPRTGKCADKEIASVTIVSNRSMYADALSTAIFVMGKDAVSLCEKYPGTDAFIIMENGETLTTDGFSEKYNLALN